MLLLHLTEYCPHGIIYLPNLYKKGDKKMRKLTAIILSLVFVLSTLACLAVPVSADGTAKNDLELLYSVKFDGSDSKYQPYIFGANVEDNAKTLVPTVSEDGNELTLKYSPASAGRACYGAKIDGLTLGKGKQYTYEMQIKLPAANAGFFFNLGEPVKYDGTNFDEMKNDTEYLKMLGFYGQTKADSNCMTLAAAAGAKIQGDIISDAKAYTPVPKAAQVGVEYVTATVVVDEYKFAVYFNGELYDQTDISEGILDESNNVAIVYYLYNAGELNVKDVKVYKGCKYEITDKRTSAKAAPGYKLADLNFKGDNDGYKPVLIQNSGNTTVTVSEDGKSVTFKQGKKGGTWYGSNIKGLKITDTSKYTMQFKIKTVGETTVGIGYNIVWPYTTLAITQEVKNGDTVIEDKGPVYSSRLNFYGNFNDMNSKRSLKFANHGTNLNAYGYDTFAEILETFKPKIDADGFTDVAYEINGKKSVSLYMRGEDGKMTLIKEVDLSGYDYYKNSTDLAFIVYIYNKNRVATIKDAAVYAGNIISGQPEAFAGEGTAEKPYLINSAEDLKLLAELVNLGYSFEGKYFTQTADIDLKNEEWTAIGTAATPFCGVYDGKTFKITNLSVTKRVKYAGLFGCVKPTDNSDAGLANINVSGKIAFEGAADWDCIGGLVAMFNQEQDKACKLYAINCTVNVDIDVKASGQPRIGGAFGCAFMANVDNVVNNGNLKVVAAKCSRVGGITGQTNSVTYKNCVNNGNVEVTTAGETTYAAGIAAVITYRANQNTVFDNCVNNGKITGITTDKCVQVFVGGIAGGIYSAASPKVLNLTIKNCVNNGELYGETGEGKSAYAYVGGMMPYDNIANTVIENCVNTVDPATGMKSVGGNGGRAGGIVGVIYKGDNIIVKNSTTVGKVAGWNQNSEKTNIVETKEVEADKAEEVAKVVEAGKALSDAIKPSEIKIAGMPTNEMTPPAPPTPTPTPTATGDNTVIMIAAFALAMVAGLALVFVPKKKEN